MFFQTRVKMDNTTFVAKFNIGDNYTSLISRGNYGRVIDPDTNCKKESQPLQFPYCVTYKIVSGADILGHQNYGVITPNAITAYFEKNNLRIPTIIEALLAFAENLQLGSEVPVIAFCGSEGVAVVHTCMDYYGRGGQYIDGKRNLKILPPNDEITFRNFCMFLAVVV